MGDLPWVSYLTTVLFVTLFGSPAESREYRVGAGDVLELNVVGVPELQARAVVGPDGTASFPLVEELAVAGRPLGEIRGELRVKLSLKVVPRQNGDGVNDTVAFSQEQISLRIAEYRPVFVSGHVAKPGEQNYRIGMTVREAVAVAGGHSLFPYSTNPTDALKVQSEYSVLLNEVAREQTRLLRLRAEYDRLPSFEGAIAADKARRLQPDLDLVQLEAQQFKSRTAAHSNEKRYLEQATETIDKHLALLKERRAKEIESLEADQADLSRVNELFRKGMTVAERVSEARRSLLVSATRSLQTDAGIASAEREAMSVTREIARLEEQRTQLLIKEIQDAELKIQNTRTKMMFLAQQVPLMAGSMLSLSDEQNTKITIHRRNTETSEKISARPDSELWPGDVVEIISSTFNSDFASVTRKRD